MLLGQAVECGAIHENEDFSAGLDHDGRSLGVIFLVVHLADRLGCLVLLLFAFIHQRGDSVNGASSLGSSAPSLSLSSGSKRRGRSGWSNSSRSLLGSPDLPVQELHLDEGPRCPPFSTISLPLSSKMSVCFLPFLAASRFPPRLLGIGCASWPHESSSAHRILSSSFAPSLMALPRSLSSSSCL